MKDIRLDHILEIIRNSKFLILIITGTVMTAVMIFSLYYAKQLYEARAYINISKFGLNANQLGEIVKLYEESGSRQVWINRPETKYVKVDLLNTSLKIRLSISTYDFDLAHQFAQEETIALVLAARKYKIDFLMEQKEDLEAAITEIDEQIVMFIYQISSSESKNNVEIFEKHISLLKENIIRLYGKENSDLDFQTTPYHSYGTDLNYMQERKNMLINELALIQFVEQLSDLSLLDQLSREDYDIYFTLTEKKVATTNILISVLSELDSLEQTSDEYMLNYISYQLPEKQPFIRRWLLDTVIAGMLTFMFVIMVLLSRIEKQQV